MTIHATQASACDSLKDVLLGRYGSPVRESQALFVWETLWRDAAGKNLVKLTQLGSGKGTSDCAVAYTPLQGEDSGL